MKKIITRRRFNIVSMFTIVVLLANLLIIDIANKSYANKIQEKYDLRDDIGTIIGDESQNNSKPQGSLKAATIIQLESHIKLGKKDGKYSSYTDEVLSNLSKIESELDYKVKAIFPIYKEWASTGVKYYTNTEGKEATSDELKERRESLKHTILSYGGVIAYISDSGIKDGLNNSGKVCFSKDIVTAAGNQAVVIIGWDDNFSKNNFQENCRPTSDGAFLVQSFNDVFYVSYEDIYIENNLRYIDSVEELKSSNNEEKNEDEKEEEKKEETPGSTTPEEQEKSTKNEDTPEQQENDKKPEKQEEPSKSDEPIATPEEQTKEPTVSENKPENQEEKSVDNGSTEITPEPPENVENKVEEKENEGNKVTEKEEKEVVVDPSIPTEVTKVETSNDGALEIDTSSIKDTPAKSNKSTTQTSSTYANGTSANDTKNTEPEYVSNANIANSKLPQTGSNAEIYLVIAIAAVMFIAFIVHSLRNVISSDKM